MYSNPKGYVRYTIGEKEYTEELDLHISFDSLLLFEQEIKKILYFRYSPILLDIDIQYMYVAISDRGLINNSVFVYT
jgi:hypothetical protein